MHTVHLRVCNSFAYKKHILPTNKRKNVVPSGASPAPDAAFTRESKRRAMLLMEQLQGQKKGLEKPWKAKEPNHPKMQLIDFFW